MGFTEKQTQELMAPLHTSHIASRTQSGRALSYIEGWHAIAEANRIFGFGCWHRETVELRQTVEVGRKMGANKDKDGWQVSYNARVRVTVFVDEGPSIVREGWGSGHGIDSDLGLAHESAAKEAETDAMKRAMMTFGNPFGLALYDKERTNVTDRIVDTVKLLDFETGVADAETVKEIEAVYKEHRDNLAGLSETDPTEFGRLRDLYAARKKELKEREAQSNGSK